MPGVGAVDVLSQMILSGAQAVEELVDLGDGKYGLTYDYLTDLADDAGVDDVQKVIDGLVAGGCIDDPARQMVVFPPAVQPASWAAMIRSNSIYVHHIPSSGGQAFGTHVQRVLNASAMIDTDDDGNEEPEEKPRQTDPLVVGLLMAGEMEPDGSIYLNQQHVENYLKSQGKNPISARGIISMLISNGAEDLGNGEIIVPIAMVKQLAPDLAGNRPPTYGRRLPDGSAIMTVADAEEMLKADGGDPADAKEWLDNLVDFGAVWKGDELVIPPDIVDTFALPVPPIPSVRRRAAQAVQDASQAQQTSAAQTVAQLFGLDEEIQTVRHKQVIQHDYFDKEMFNDIVSMSPSMQENVEAGREILKTWDELCMDLWHLIYKIEPKIRSEKEMDPAYLANLYLVLYAMQTDSFKELREFTAGSLMDSILGYEVIVLEVLGYIRKKMEEYEEQKRQAMEAYQQALQEWQQNGGQGPKPQNPIAPGGVYMPGGVPLPGSYIAQSNYIYELQQQAQQAQDIIDAVNSMAGPNGQLPQELAEALAEAQQQAQQAQQALEQMQQELQKAAQDLAGQLKNALNDIGDAAIGQTTEIRKVLEQWGLNNGQRPSEVRINFQDAKRAIERIRHSRKFQEFAKILGRFRNIALADVKRRSTKSGVAIKSVKVGNKVENALPGEYAMLCDPVLENEFYRKYAEGQLLEYEKENTDAKGRGPMVVCLDNSGSMSGNKLTWAKALVLSLLEIAQKQRRDFALIVFCHTIYKIFIVEKDRLDPNDLLDISEIGATGGTQFEEPLEVAMQVITGRYEHPMLKEIVKKLNLTSNRFKKADLTFITDGDSWWSDCSLPNGYWSYTPEQLRAEARKHSKFLKKLLETKEEKEFTIRGVLINVDGGASDRCLSTFCDKIIRLDNISDLSEAKAAEIFSDVRGVSVDDLDVDINSDALDDDTDSDN